MWPLLSRSGQMEEEKAAESPSCHIAKRMHCAALENVKGGRKTLIFS